jgi:transposase
VRDFVSGAYRPIGSCIKDLLPGHEGHVRLKARDNRLFVEAVLYRYRAGIPWRDLPERFGDPIKVFTAVFPLAKSGVWERIFVPSTDRDRHLIENFFPRLKQFRTIATRYDKTRRNFLVAIQLPAAIIWRGQALASVRSTIASSAPRRLGQIDCHVSSGTNRVDGGEKLGDVVANCGPVRRRQHNEGQPLACQVLLVLHVLIACDEGGEASLLRRPDKFPIAECCPAQKCGVDSLVRAEQPSQVLRDVVIQQYADGRHDAWRNRRSGASAQPQGPGTCRLAPRESRRPCCR